MAETKDFTSTLTQIQESVGKLLMGALFDQITTLRTPWVITPQQQQQDVLDRLRMAVENATCVAVRRIATEGFSHITAQIDSLTIKDEAKVNVVLPRGTQDIHTLADHVGSKVVIVFADPAAYIDGMHEFKAQADQPELPLGDAA
jgi:hypothetical protein